MRGERVIVWEQMNVTDLMDPCAAPALPHWPANKIPPLPLGATAFSSEKVKGLDLVGSEVPF